MIQLYRRLQLVNACVIAATENFLLVVVSLICAIVTTALFGAVRFDGGLAPTGFLGSFALILLANGELMLGKPFRFMCDSKAYISATKERATSNYVKSTSKSLKPLNISLRLRYIDSANIFIAIMNDVIIPNLISLLVTF